MKKTVVLFFVICIISCSKDNEIEQSSGTKLISIEYEDDNDSWIENYSYSSNDELIKIEDFRSLGRRYCLLYTSDAADERSSVDLGGRRIIKKKMT